MQIRPTFWDQMRRLCADRLRDSVALQAEIDAMIDHILDAARSEQHRLTARLLSTLGGSPNAVDLGFLIGRQLPLTSYGTLSLGVLTAPTVGDALRFVSDVQHLVIPLIDYSYDETAVEGRFTIGFRCPIDSKGEALTVAACAAIIDREVARYSGHAGNFSRVELTPSSKGAAESYRKHLCLTPYSDGNANRLVIPRSALDLPNPHADADTFKSVVRTCMERSDLQVYGVPLLDRMREIIMSDIGAPPSLERLAKALDLTPRQLRERLKWGRTNYQAVVRDCRMQYAGALLNNAAVPLSQIAGRLGYSDLSAFSHAFNRWTGRSPSAFRNEIRQRHSSP